MAELPTLEQLQQHLQELPSAERVRYCIELAQQASRQDPSRIADFARCAYEEALAIGDAEGEAEAMRLLGVGALFAGRYPEAVQWLQRSAQAFEHQGRKESQLHALLSLALAYHSLGNTEQAVGALQHVLQEGQPFPILRLKALQNLGVIFGEVRHYEQALRCFEDAIELARRCGERRELARAYTNAAQILASMGRYAEALEHHRRGVELKQQLGDLYGGALSYATLGYVLASQRRYAEAIWAYEQSLEMRRSLQDERGSAHVLLNLAWLWRRLGNFEAAAERLREAAAIAQRLGEAPLLYELWREQTELEAARGDFAAALSSLRRALELLEQLTNERTRRAVVDMEVRYELERQQRRQEQLRLQLLEWQYRAVQAQLSPHFLYNALMTARTLMQQHAEAAEQYLRDLAALMRHIVEALDKPLVPLATELEIARLYLELERRNGKLQLEYAIELEPSLDAHESCVPPLLLQPIVENALKHGLAPKGGGRLRIAAWAEGEQLLIAIEDDGVGRSSEGVSRRQHRSMGLQLTTERLRLLQQSVGRRAEFEIQDLHREDGCPAGTRVLFRLPAELTLQDMELGPPPP